MSKIFKENWKIGTYGTCIVSDTPHIKGHDRSSIEHYGGHLVCKSVLDPRHAAIIAAAPALLHALESIENDDGRIPESIWAMRNEALQMAKSHRS